MATTKVLKETITPSKGVTAFDAETTYSPFRPGGNIQGTCASGWESVKEAFGKNFANGREKEAQLCIRAGDEIVVDLIGVGAAETQLSSEYSHDTVQAIFSSGKNLEVVVVAMLVDRGLIKYTDKISKHWPAFGQNGKTEFTIADLMRHSAGMAYFVDPNDKNSFRMLTMEDVESREPMHRLMETSPPQNLEGTKRTYHTSTRGFVIDGILKHVDPKGRTIGQFAREEILKPLGIEQSYFVSLTPQDAKKVSVATMHQFPTMFTVCHEIGPALLGAGDPLLSRASALMSPDSIIVRSGCGIDMINTGQVDPKTGESSVNFLNSEDSRARKAECTSAYSFASARALTKIHSLFANGGEVDGVRLFSEETAKMALDEIVVENDDSLFLYGGFTQGGLGDLSSFKDSEDKYGQIDSCKGFFGWGGWGGSLNLAHPGKKVTVSYAMTGMDVYIFGDPRTVQIMKAVAKVVDHLGSMATEHPQQ